MKCVFYSLLIALSLFACKNDKNGAGEYAYLGGEIINPNSDVVIIYKSECTIDTIKLDNHNRFIYKIYDLQPGFYTFRHGSEIQMVLLEPNDSIMFRLNTLDFDESLVYSGKGAKKNNYFINEFLQNEIIEKNVFQLCQLDPITFEKKIDSIRAQKEQELTDFLSHNVTSDLFNTIAKTNIDYNYYSSKEFYPIINYGYKKRSIFNELPKNFYNYRKDVAYNNEGNQDYLSYSSFLRTSFNNMSLEKHLSHSQGEYFNNSTSVCFNLDRLNLIDSLVINQTIKNDLLYHFTMTFLTKNNVIENNDIITKKFLSKSTNKEKNKIIIDLTESLNSLKPGEVFPNIKVVNFENSELSFNSLITKPTAVYFWSHNLYGHFKDSHFKANELKEKYPEVDFIAINIDEFNFNAWVETLKRNHFSLTNEYQFKNPEESMHKLAIYPMTKVILIDKNNIIINSNSNLFSSNFEEQLLGLINR